MSILYKLFNISLPIIQAPMAGVQGWELAAATSAAGGLGSLPCAMLTPEGVREAVLKIREHTLKPINLNFFSHVQPQPDESRQKAWLEKFRPYYEELGIGMPENIGGAGRQPFNEAMAEVVCELKPEVVSFHFGLPESSLLQKVRDTGAKVLSSATTVEEARWLDARGVDAIIAQGIEAGGHRGMFLSEDISTQTGTFELLSQIMNAVTVPVIAAGGIADAKGVNAAMLLGAAGVQVGTAFLLCHETNTSAVHRAALQSEAAHTTALTNIFSGRPARGIVNRMIHELGPINPQAPCFPFATAASAPLRAHAERMGSADFTPLWAGQNTRGCREVPAAELIAMLSRGLLI
ncbi:nitronate monooxygenase [Marinobacterium halophilum]|uniref:Nitronate monooxygenase n=1 Tax=Marinobacterium halophilum TaxID=267374 RepID=A0A2P8EZS7_9GAMM|nr:nitronate monooxygenase [Marinobacterium halophilum]PSL14974.1 nitronate monooxygenase [Marinobacterium halophilum]